MFLHVFELSLLTKDSFPLTSFFLCYQTLENVENYLYRRFSSETNRALNWNLELIGNSSTILLGNPMKIKKNPFCSRNYYNWVAFQAAVSSIYTIFSHHFRRQHHSNCNISSENRVLTRYAFNLKRTKPTIKFPLQSNHTQNFIKPNQ